MHYSQVRGWYISKARIVKSLTFFPDLESDDLIEPGTDEVKDNQWLGVTVRSQGAGGKVMVSRQSRK